MGVIFPSGAIGAKDDRSVHAARLGLKLYTAAGAVSDVFSKVRESIEKARVRDLFSPAKQGYFRALVSLERGKGVKRFVELAGYLREEVDEREILLEDQPEMVFSQARELGTIWEGLRKRAVEAVMADFDKEEETLKAQFRQGAVRSLKAKGISVVEDARDAISETAVSAKLFEELCKICDTDPALLASVMRELRHRRFLSASEFDQINSRLDLVVNVSSTIRTERATVAQRLDVLGSAKKTLQERANIEVCGLVNELLAEQIFADQRLGDSDSPFWKAFSSEICRSIELCRRLEERERERGYKDGLVAKFAEAREELSMFALKNGITSAKKRS